MGSWTTGLIAFVCLHGFPDTALRCRLVGICDAAWAIALFMRLCAVLPFHWAFHTRSALMHDACPVHVASNPTTPRSATTGVLAAVGGLAAMLTALSASVGMSVPLSATTVKWRGSAALLRLIPRCAGQQLVHQLLPAAVRPLSAPDRRIVLPLWRRWSPAPDPRTWLRVDAADRCS